MFPPSDTRLHSLMHQTQSLGWWPLVILVVMVITYLILHKHINKRFPPGPPAKPLVGNIFEVSAQAGWLKFTEYKKTYGDIIYFHGLGNKVLVLNSMRVILDLLEKKANIYSDRPVFTMIGELMGAGQSLPWLPYNDEWRAQRKLAHHALSPRGVKQYHGIQEDLAVLLCKELLAAPRELFFHVRLTASRLIMSITYGLSVTKTDDEYIFHAEDTMRLVSEASVPGAFLCDLIPPLKYLPSWFAFQKTARMGRSMIDQMVTRPLDRVREGMRSGTAPPSLAKELLSMSTDDKMSHEHGVKWTTGSLYSAGAETTYSTVLTCILAMMLHPDKLKNAQEELDRVVGMDRMPTISDREDLPYLGAVIKETMRWHPTVPLSLARCTAREDFYDGYTIPKGTIVVPNTWAIAFEKIGPYDPKEFIPERFLVSCDEDRPIDPSSYAFGFARRICPGRYLAENSVFILLAAVLSTFDILPPADGSPKVKFTEGLVSYPEPFECRILPRSANKASQVLWRAAQCNTTNAG